MDDGSDKEATGIGEDMAFAALDRFSRVKAAWTAAFGGFDTSSCR